MKRSFWGRIWFRLRQLFAAIFERRRSVDAVEERPSLQQPVAESAPVEEQSDSAVTQDESSARVIDSESSETQTATEKPSTVPRSYPVKGSKDTVFGIDFGTTFTSVAVISDGKMTLLKDETDNTMFPSIVCYPPDEQSIVGWRARSQSVMHPASTFTSPKRLIGRRFDDRHIESALGALAVPTRAGPNGQIVADVNGSTLALPQVCAEVFRHASDLGLRAMGERIQRIVLSVPVEYHSERQAIVRAAKMAGLDVAGVIEEPVSSAIGFGFDKQAGLVAVYDFGGGTFDCTLLEVQNGRFRILAKAGDAWLGGDDFDLAIAEHAARSFWRMTKIDLHQRRAEWQRVLVASEAAKRRLSETSETELVVPELVLTASGPIDLRINLNRLTLAELCGPLVDRSIQVMETCLQQGNVTAQQVVHIAMTGGVCRMPLVQQSVEKFFGREVPLPVDPEHAVVAGNAIYGHFIGARKAE